MATASRFKSHCTEMPTHLIIHTISIIKIIATDIYPTGNNLFTAVQYYSPGTLLHGPQ